MCLIIWDKIFGTFQEEMVHVKPKYGLTSPLKSPRIPEAIFHEWKNLRSDITRSLPLKVKLKYIFFPPGWSHTGEDKTTKGLQASLKESRGPAQ